MPFNNCQQCGRLFHFLEPTHPSEAADNWPSDTDSNCPECRQSIRDSANVGDGVYDGNILSGVATCRVEPDEFDKLEKSFGMRFPAAYRDYLRVCGKEPPIGSDCEIRHLSTINKDATELVAENNVAEHFPGRIFVFAMHQGDSFLYFPVGASDDPSVYCYVAGDTKPTQVSQRFSDWASGLESPDPLA